MVQFRNFGVYQLAMVTFFFGQIFFTKSSFSMTCQMGCRSASRPSEICSHDWNWLADQSPGIEEGKE